MWGGGDKEARGQDYLFIQPRLDISPAAQLLVLLTSQ